MLKKVLLAVGVVIAVTSIPMAIADKVSQDYKATYSIASPAVAPSPSGVPSTDTCTLTGSATKTVKITRIEISATQTTAGENVIFLTRRSAANSSGTSTSPSPVPHNSLMGAATAVFKAYTVTPSPGPSLGNVRALHLVAPVPAGTTSGYYAWDFDVDHQGQPIYLNGTGDLISVNLGSASVPTGFSMVCNFTWTEE